MGTSLWISRGIAVSSGLLLSSWSTIVTAEDGAAALTNQATQSLIDNSSGSVFVGHYAFGKANKNGNVGSTTPKVRTKGYLGLALFKDKLNTSLMMGAEKGTESVKVASLRPELESILSAYKGDVVSISPYVFAYLPHEGLGTDGSLGTTISLAQSLDLTGGSLTLKSIADLAGGFSSREQDATYANSSQKPSAELGLLGLTGIKEEKANGDVVVEGGKKDPSFDTNLTLMASFAPSLLKGFSVSLISTLYRTYDPNYSIVEDGSVETTYGVTDTMEDVLKLSYGATDDLSLGLSLVQYHSGIYESSVAADKTKYLAVSSVSYTMF